MPALWVDRASFLALFWHSMRILGGVRFWVAQKSVGFFVFQATFAGHGEFGGFAANALGMFMQGRLKFVDKADELSGFLGGNDTPTEFPNPVLKTPFHVLEQG